LTVDTEGEDIPNGLGNSYQRKERAFGTLKGRIGKRRDYYYFRKGIFSTELNSLTRFLKIREGILELTILYYFLRNQNLVGLKPFRQRIPTGKGFLSPTTLGDFFSRVRVNTLGFGPLFLNLIGNCGSHRFPTGDLFGTPSGTFIQSPGSL